MATATRPKSTPVTPMFDQPLPADMDSEMALVGSVILDPNVIDEVVSLVRPEDFLDDRHGKLFGVMREMYEEGKRIDTTLLLNALKKRKLLEAIGGMAYIAQLARYVPHAANAVFYACNVREASTFRELISASTVTAREAYEAAEDAKMVANSAEQRFFDIVNRQAVKETATIKEALHEAMDRIDERKDGKGEKGVETGFIELDGLTGGLHKSQLIILAARPACGKSALAMNIAVNAAMRDQPVLFVSLEMAQAELAERMLAAQAKVNSHRLKEGSISNDDRERLRKAAGRMHEMPLFMNDNAGLTVTEISAEARRVRRKAKGLALVVIDYLQLIEPDDHKAPRQEQVSRISRRLKLLAKQLECPVLCLSQLNRQADQGESRPRLSHLRESGAIEQDADVVMFIHREEKDADGNPVPEGQVEIIVAKQRNGPIGEATVLWQKQFVRFVNKSEEFLESLNEAYARVGDDEPYESDGEYDGPQAEFF